MKRLKVVSSLLMIVLSPILLGGCTFSGDINKACFQELFNIKSEGHCEYEFKLEL